MNPTLDDKGVALVKGDVVTIEPGLYGTLVGGIRVKTCTPSKMAAPPNLEAPCTKSSLGQVISMSSRQKKYLNLQPLVGTRIKVSAEAES